MYGNWTSRNRPRDKNQAGCSGSDVNPLPSHSENLGEIPHTSSVLSKSKKLSSVKQKQLKSNPTANLDKFITKTTASQKMFLIKP